MSSIRLSSHGYLKAGFPVLGYFPVFESVMNLPCMSPGSNDAVWPFGRGTTKQGYSYDNRHRKVF